MGHVSSKIQNINNVRFEPIPSGRQLKGIVACTRAENWLFLMHKSGAIYTEHEISRKTCFCLTGSDYAPVRALLAFGIITKAEALKHGEMKRAYDLNCERYYAATHVIEHFYAIGIKLTKAQLTKLAEAGKAVDIDSLPHYIYNAKAKLGRK